MNFAEAVLQSIRVCKLQFPAIQADLIQSDFDLGKP